MSDRKFAAALGFAFVAAWVGFGFLSAVFCLAGAAAFWAAAALVAGKLDIEELEERLTAARDAAFAGSNERGGRRQPSRVR